jgi:hypothetical protein
MTLQHDGMVNIGGDHVPAEAERFVDPGKNLTHSFTHAQGIDGDTEQIDPMARHLTELLNYAAGFCHDAPDLHTQNVLQENLSVF